MEKKKTTIHEMREEIVAAFKAYTTAETRLMDLETLQVLEKGWEAEQLKAAVSERRDLYHATCKIRTTLEVLLNEVYGFKICVTRDMMVSELQDIFDLYASEEALGLAMVHCRESFAYREISSGHKISTEY
ncbi:MAG: hypothetical protein SNH18_10360 [Rikenellaceae bacterium]